MVNKCKANPLITKFDIKASRPDFEVMGVFNPGVAQAGDEVVLLLRVAERPLQRYPESYSCPVFDRKTGKVVVHNIPMHAEGVDMDDPRVVVTPRQNYLTSMSHLRVARSADGIHFTIDDHPALEPMTEYEAFGVEDPRITCLDGTYYIACSSASELGIVVSMYSTQDFKAFTREGVLFTPDNKDVAIFPQKINGRYYALHRPSTSHYGKPEIWIAASPDLHCWGEHRILAGVRTGSWDNGRVGASAVPFLTDRGWIELYHGADGNNRYCLGAMLLDAEEPWRVLKRSRVPLAEPSEPYELDGFFGNVIFSCGCLVRGEEVTVYYGAADDSVASLTLTLDDIYRNLDA